MRGSDSWGRGRVHVPGEEGGEGFMFLGRREGDGFTFLGRREVEGLTSPIHCLLSGKVVSH